MIIVENILLFHQNVRGLRGAGGQRLTLNTMAAGSIDLLRRFIFFLLCKDIA